MKTLHLHRLTLAALLVSASVLPAEAAPRNDMPRSAYFGISGDAMWLHDSSVNGGTTPRLDYDFGWGANAMVGTMIAPSASSMGDFRLEAEGGYKQAGLDNARGHLWAATYMGNLYFDLRNMPAWLTANSQLVPYIGAGAGGAYVHLPNSAIGGTDKHDNVFAYQFMAGVSFVMGSMPNTDWSLGYKYFATADPDFGGVKVDHLRSNNIELGMKWHF